MFFFFLGRVREQGPVTTQSRLRDRTVDSKYTGKIAADGLRGTMTIRRIMPVGSGGAAADLMTGLRTGLRSELVRRNGQHVSARTHE